MTKKYKVNIYIYPIRHDVQSEILEVTGYNILSDLDLFLSNTFFSTAVKQALNQCFNDLSLLGSGVLFNRPQRHPQTNE